MNSPESTAPDFPLRRWIVPAAILGALVLRLAWPAADPPVRLSWSNGIYTDPPTMVHAARNAHLYGEWIRDYNRDLYVYPLTNFLTWLSYLPVGPGRLPTLILSALAGTLTVAGLAWALWRSAGPRAAALGAVLAATCHWLVMYSRIPIAENVTGMLMTLACVAGISRGPRSQFLSGGLAAAAVFFGKFHAVGFLLAMIAFVLMREQGLKGSRPFLLGAGLAIGSWGLGIFLPHREEIVAHVIRQSTGYHGDLPFTVSLLNGLGEIFNTLRRSWMFYRMPVCGIVGCFVAVWVLGNGAARRRGLRDGHAIWAFWFLGMWIYFSLLSYKAPRYYVLVAPPLVALTAITLDRALARGARVIAAPVRWDEHLPLVIGLYAFFFGAIDGAKHYASMALEYLILPPARISDDAYNFVVRIFQNVDTFLQNVSWAGIFTIATYVLILWHREILGVFGVRSLRLSGRTSARGAAVLLGISIVWAAWQYGWWVVHRSYYVEEMKTTVPQIIGPDAVVLGPLAPLLTQDTSIATLPYFGPPGERGILETYGVTHLAVCGAGDGQLVEKRFPGLLEQTTVVQSWPVRTLFAGTLDIRRLPRAVDGVPIHEYTPTRYEELFEVVAQERWSEGLELIRRYRESGEEEIPELVSLEYLCWFKLEDYDRAERMIREAIRRRPRDPINHTNLGVLRLNRGDREGALRSLITALRIDPRNKELEEMIRELTR